MSKGNNKKACLVGVSFDESKIRAGIFDHSHRLLATIKLSAKSERGAQAVIARIARCVRDVVDEADLTLKDVSGVGVGAPGPVDRQTGTVTSASALNWEKVVLQKPLSDLLGLPVVVENDGHLAALGVHVVEFKSTPLPLMAIFVGTGLGGAMIVDCEPHDLFAPRSDLGHMPLLDDGPVCACGKKGCFEAIASRRGIIRRIKHAIMDGEQTTLTERVPNLDQVRSKDLRKALRRGDDLVRRFVDSAARGIGIALARLAQTCKPEIVVIGGDVLEALGDRMLGIILETARQHALSDNIRILLSTLGDNASITGAAILAERMVK